MTPHSFYLAGPMTGIPQFNFPAFDSAAAELRDQGYEIVSPAELDDPATREAALASPDGAPGSGSANDESYGTFLSRDVKLIIDDVDGIVTLPDWWKSRGARIEVFTAVTMSKPIYEYLPGEGTFLAEPLRFSELEKHLKPGDPGNGSQHQTPAEAAGPPFESRFPDRPIAYPAAQPSFEEGDINKTILESVPEGLINAAKNAIEEAHIRLQTPERIEVDESAPGVRDISQLWGLPVKVSAVCEPGWLHVVADMETISVPWKPYEATREPGHIHEEVRMPGEPAPIVQLSGHGVEGEERITSASGGQKGQKLCAIGDLDPAALMQVGDVAGFGAWKYARLNYTKGFEWSLAFNALMRHALLFWSGEDTDEESQLPHMAHAAWQCLCLLTFSQQMRGIDDRHINFYMEGEPRELGS